MFDTLLVANRGEIACRVIQTAQRMGLRTVAVYSEADRYARHVTMADEAQLLGGASALDSYLRVDRVIDAARQTGAQAIHPGYGFLSENAEFAQACETAGLIFVGPSAEAIRTMGSKTASKQLMQQAGVPILPGYHENDQDPTMLAEKALEVGFPLLIKASAGGGGKGMRLVGSQAEFDQQLEGAKREALAAFGDDSVLLERYLTAPKHIEVQLMADTHGNVVYLFERDCSVQRRHQKVIEEAPAPGADEALRARLGQAAVQVAQQVGYVGAGTVEFIAEGQQFYFMEMNTRLQVEHPVSEAITGVDLVEWQLRVAAGEPLPLSQEQLSINGHAIEVRLYAENPRKKFLPSTGQLVRFALPEDVRVDTGVVQGDVVSMHYDPMLAKIIAHGVDREAARRQLAAALGDAQVAGVEHNLGYLRALLEHQQFIDGDYTTGIAEQVHDAVVPDVAAEYAGFAALWRVLRAEQPNQPWMINDGFRGHLPNQIALSLKQGKRLYACQISGHTLTVDDQSLSVSQWCLATDGSLRLLWHGQPVTVYFAVAGATIYVMCQGHTERFTDLTDDLGAYATGAASAGGIASPMPGQVIAVNVKAGDKVATGDVLLVVEAMKMEHSITAAAPGQITEVRCQVGDRVEEGVELVALDV